MGTRNALRLCIVLLGAAGLSCRSVPLASPPSPGRLQALVGADALTAGLAHQAGKCVLVCHSPRCWFCRSILRSIERTLPQLGPEAQGYSVDIDLTPGARDRLRLGWVPVVIFLEDGQEITRWRLYRLPFQVHRGLRRYFAP